MAPETLTDYERRRLENIRRNNEMVASLMLQRKASELSSSLKSRRPSKSPKPTLNASPSSPVVLRRSLRTRGVPPSTDPTQTPPPNSPPAPLPARKRGPLLIREAIVGDPDRRLTDTILAAAAAKPKVEEFEGKVFDPVKSLELRRGNAEKVVSDRILSVRFFPFVDRNVVVVGNMLGNVGFWDVDSVNGDGVYVYAPHSAPVSGISIHPFSATKMYTGSYDGFVRLMDAKNETFNMIYSSNQCIYSICQWPRDINCLHVGEGAGDMNVWDERTGKASSSWELHEDRINTIDFHPQNLNFMATSSTDGTACIWDLRKMKKDKPESIKTVDLGRAVHSAFFSPSGNSIATTSINDRVGILSGTNFDDVSSINHYNQTGRWLCSFRAIWGWDDSYLYIGNMKRAIDIISTADKSTSSLESPDMTSIPCRIAAHPYKEGSLAGANATGKVFLWTKS